MKEFFGDIERITEKIREGVPESVLNILLACLTVIAGLVLLRVGKKLIRRAFAAWRRRHPKKGSRGDEGSGKNETALTLITSIYTYVLYFAMLIEVLQCLGVDVRSLIAVAGVGGVAIGFGCQTLVKDFISGLFLWVDGSVRVGDIVTVNGSTGTVENVALRTTTVRTMNGNIIMIPNGDIRTVTNLSRDYRCAMVDIPVSAGQDLKHALDVMREAVKNLPEVDPIIQEIPNVVGYIANDRFSVTARIECRCNIDDCWTAERLIRLEVLEALRKAEIK